VVEPAGAGPAGADPEESAERLARLLAEHGHPQHAHGLRRALARGAGGAGRAVLLALDEACQTLLSAVEAFDPETEGLIEELRLSIDRRLKPPGKEAGPEPGAKAGAKGTPAG
jgi:hypothetical protein